MNRRFTSILIPILIFICLIRSGSAQMPVKNYAAQWKKVESFIEKELPKSALEEVRNIYAMAKREKQDAQVIKSLVYIMDLQQQTREDNEIQSIAEIEKEIVASKEPVTSLLKSMLAGLYWDYFQQHRWELYDRSRTVNFVKTDIATWSSEDLHKRIGELYLQSLQSKQSLQSVKLTLYDAILVKGNVRHLRPTVFDLLAFRALNYFSNDEREIRKAASSFELNQDYAFEPAASFIKRKFTPADSVSLKYKALLVYQELLAFHLNDAKPDAFIDADLHRLEYVKNNSVHPEKDKLYYQAVQAIANKYKDLPAASQAWFLLAEYHEEQANKYQPYGDTTTRYERLKAKDILDRILLQKDSSEGKINAFNLLRSIQSKELQFNIEKVNVPNEPMRTLVQYRNFNQLHLRVIRVTEDIRNLMERQHEDAYWKLLSSATPVKSWQQNLPATNDMQMHRAEIKVDALPIGEYILLASPDKDFNIAKSLIGARLFFVSNISFVNNERDYFILHRDNGKPLARAAVQIWEQRYDYNQSKYIKVKGKSYQSDANGFFRMQKDKDANRYGSFTYLLEIQHNSDKLFMNDPIYDYYYYRDGSETEIKTSQVIYLFTDRSLYRPGQTVFFKGIVITKEGELSKTRVNDNYETTLYLRDANYQLTDSIKVKTNEFGSFSGKFQLPQSGLNGQFTLFTKKDPAQAYFHMEEYKRPKFYVEFEPIKGTYKVNDDITVTGFAKAYAGNNIDGATVKYRVVRTPRFIYPWLYRRWWLPRSEPLEITHGEVKTGADGKFTVTFKAIPDLKVDKKFEPVFDYKIYADVTDINGETRSSEELVSVSYKSLMLVTAIPDRVSVDSLKKLTVYTRNMNGEHQKADVKVVFTKLKTEPRLIRNRYWERPDQFVMSKEEYIRQFPHDEYDNEADPKSWEKEQQVLSKTDSTRVSGEWPLGNAPLPEGYYMIEFETKDKNGETVKDVKYVELYKETSTTPQLPVYLWTGNEKTLVEPGESAQISLGTSVPEVFMVQQVDRINTEEPAYSFIQMGANKKEFRFAVNEADRGGYGVGWMFVKHNRVFQVARTITVPWSNKQLNIEFASFRDKLLPGSEEKWKIRITGHKNEKIAAEMLATMYDASLDQFYPHQVSTPSLWPGYYNLQLWKTDQNFNDVVSNQKYIPQEEIMKSLEKIYDQFIFQDRSYYNPRLMRLGKPVAANEYRTGPPTVENSQGADEVVVTAHGDVREKDADGIADTSAQSGKPPQQGTEVQVRKNFNETAFFFPELRTDSSGAIEFSFTIPEALTRWKFMGLAHTKEAAFGNTTKEIVTQKELMVQPNAPRFLREGDRLELTTKIVNLSDKEFTGQAELQLFDATTNQQVDGLFRNSMPNQYFTVAAGQSDVVRFPVNVPFQYNRPLVYRIVARAGNYSDGEENAMPVLTNRMLVTETMPLPMKGEGTKTFTFPKLLDAGKSETLQHHALTIEYTSNPVWYAVQALPYLMEYPYECAEQNWNRYYANSLATYIANSSPRIREVFEKWKIKDTAALMSNLQKNQELKAVLLEETPWVVQGKTEAEQKKNIALLFDLVRMSQELNNNYEKLKQMQSSNGGFVWFKGGPDDRYMTQYIVTGIGHLKKLGAVAKGQEDKLNAILSTAIAYLDRKIKEDYDQLVKNKVNLKQKNIGYIQVQYLYMRSFFPQNKVLETSNTAYNYYFGQAKQYWTGNNKYMQGMIALAMHRAKEPQTTTAILASLKETSITHEELGMYWKNERHGWFWYEAPIETQSLMIEVFQEAGRDMATADDLRTWLLKNKQTNNWKTTKATAEAVYALLLQGSGASAIAVTTTPQVEIKLGNTVVRPDQNEPEAGTGYFKSVISGDKVNSGMGNITVTVGPTKTSSWGAVYWQYFEDLDKITTAATPLQLIKKLFIEKNTDRGPVLTPVNDGDVIKVGDKIRVRVELRVDREMEYVHMKDMRASATEPVNVLSGYRWQGGLGYYETTKDASTNFFFNSLRRGTYVFEYVLFATHAGNFSNGITTIQCMYAPEFSAHSEGIRINIE